MGEKMKDDYEQLDLEDKDIDRLICELDSVKKSPYVFLALLALPFAAYFFREPPFDVGGSVLMAILFIVVINSQFDIYLSKKKIKILSKIIKSMKSKG